MIFRPAFADTRWRIISPAKRLSQGRSVPAHGQSGQNEPQIQALSLLAKQLSSRLSSSGVTRVAEFSRNHSFFRKLLVGGDGNRMLSLLAVGLSGGRRARGDSANIRCLSVCIRGRHSFLSAI
jgi:hypothetical protein